MIAFFIKPKLSKFRLCSKISWPSIRSSLKWRFPFRNSSLVYWKIWKAAINHHRSTLDPFFPDSIKNSFLYSLHTCTQFLFPICKINLFLFFPIIFFVLCKKKNSIRSLHKRRKGFICLIPLLMCFTEACLPSYALHFLFVKCCFVFIFFILLPVGLCTTAFLRAELNVF